MLVNTKNGTYLITFHYNTELKISGVAIYKDSDFVNMGTAKCSSTDTWNKEKGRKVALSRALVEVPKEDRQEIWNYYATKLTKTPRWTIVTKEKISN